MLLISSAQKLTKLNKYVITVNYLLMHYYDRLLLRNVVIKGTLMPDKSYQNNTRSILGTKN